MTRHSRTDIAKQTLADLEAGSYQRDDGVRIDFAQDLQHCLSETKLYWPDDLKQVLADVGAQPSGSQATVIDVVNETTLAGIARLAAESDEPIAALNFASAKNPGGGFLDGSQAQEESLARSSGLYPSLMKAWPYYEHHRATASLLYSDAMIWSPHCPIIRDDEGQPLDRPRLASFITSAAPNAGAIGNNQPEALREIPGVFRRRAEYVLALAAAQGHRRLVLGAWGCGVFRNDPAMVADVFADLLGPRQWAKRFSRIAFSVLDTSGTSSVFRAFAERCGASAA